MYIMQLTNSCSLSLLYDSGRPATLFPQPVLGRSFFSMSKTVNLGMPNTCAVSQTEFTVAWWYSDTSKCLSGRISSMKPSRIWGCRVGSCKAGGVEDYVCTAVALLDTHPTRLLLLNSCSVCLLVGYLKLWSFPGLARTSLQRLLYWKLDAWSDFCEWHIPRTLNSETSNGELLLNSGKLQGWRIHSCTLIINAAHDPIYGSNLLGHA